MQKNGITANLIMYNFSNIISEINLRVLAISIYKCNKKTKNKNIKNVLTKKYNIYKM